MQQPADTIPDRQAAKLLADPDRFIRFSARVAIEHGRIERAREAHERSRPSQASSFGRVAAGDRASIPAR